MNSRKITAEELAEYKQLADFCPLVKLGNKDYAQVTTVRLTDKPQTITVLDVTDYTVVTHRGQALVEIPDEGRYMGVLVDGRNGVRWASIAPADIAVKVVNNWNQDTVSDWLESQFDH